MHEENFQKEIVELLGPKNENSSFIMADIKLDDQYIVMIAFTFGNNGYIRAMVYDYTSNDTYFFVYSDGSMIIHKNNIMIISAIINRSGYFAEVYQLKMLWENTKCDVDIKNFSLNKSRNSADVKFTFEEDYLVELYFPILAKSFLIENAVVTYKLEFDKEDENNYIWPTFFF